MSTWGSRGGGGGGGENLPAVPPIGRKPVPGATCCSRLPGLVWVPAVPVRSLPSLCCHSVALEVPEAGVEVQEPTRCSHTWGTGELSSAGAQDP